MPHTINLAVGDIAGDTHGNVDIFSVKTNLSRNHIVGAYEVGTRIVGFNITNGIGASFRDPYLYDSQYWALCKAGIDVSSIMKNSEEITGDGIYSAKVKSLLKSNNPPRYQVSPSDFKDLWLAVAKLGAPNLTWEDIPPDINLGIGGIGLYT